MKRIINEVVDAFSIGELEDSLTNVIDMLKEIRDKYPHGYIDYTDEYARFRVLVDREENDAEERIRRESKKRELKKLEIQIEELRKELMK